MTDVQHHISAVRRRVGTRVLEAGEARVVTVSRAYDTTVEDLWDACTDPERIPRWFAPVSGELGLGGRYQIEGNASGTIESCDPPHRFTATWEYGDEVSWIDVRLLPDGDGRTQLQLEHVAHVDDERWAEFGPGAVGIGWDLALLGLTLHLGDRAGSDAPLDREEVDAWAVSDEAKAFMAASSDAWCEASTAAGTPPADARAAADRTTAFYTAG